VIAENHVLASVFDDTKTPPLHLGQKCVAPDIALYVPDLAPHNPAASRSLTRKNMPKPMIRIQVDWQILHVINPTLPDHFRSR